MILLEMNCLCREKINLSIQMPNTKDSLLDLHQKIKNMAKGEALDPTIHTSFVKKMFFKYFIKLNHVFTFTVF